MSKDLDKEELIIHESIRVSQGEVIREMMRQDLERYGYVVLTKEEHRELLDKTSNNTLSEASHKADVVVSAVEIPDFVSEDQWWCPECNMIVKPESVTYEQTHDERCGGCGFTVW